MKDVDPRTSPLGEDGGPSDSFDRDHLGSRCQMVERRGIAGCPQLSFPALHDRVRLGVQRNSLSRRSNGLKTFQHLARGRRRNAAERVAHVQLEADRADVDQFRHPLDRGRTQHSVKTKVDMRLLRGHFEFRREDFAAVDGRKGIGHIEDCRDAAERSGKRSRSEVFLVRIAGIAEVNMVVDRAGQQVQPVRIQRFLGGGHRLCVADRYDNAVLDRNARGIRGIRGDNRSIVDDKICDRFHDSLTSQSIAQPPSTGRSTPVICRETSLAMKRHALAMS